MRVVVAALLAILVVARSGSVATTTTTTEEQPPIPSAGDDPYGPIDQVTWGKNQPPRPPETIEIVDSTPERLEFAVAGNLCPPAIKVDVLADAPDAVLRVRVAEWIPQEIQCADLLVSHPVVVTFTRNVDPSTLRIELHDQRASP